MKAIVALVFLGLVALSAAGLLATAPIATTVVHTPITYAAANYYTAANYRLGLDTSLPGSAYASYPYAASPTAYGYGVIKTL